MEVPRLVSQTRYHSSTSEVWDQLAPEYDELRAEDVVYWSCIEQAIEALRPAGTVLDAGCGTGATTRFLLNCEHVDALDFSASSLEVLQSNLGARENLELVQGDVRRLPFPDESFDCVLCANTINCLTPDMQPQAAAELMRVLKPGGRFVVSAHHYSRFKQRRHWVKEGRPGQPGIDYVYRFTREELAELFPHAAFRAAGFYSLPARVQNMVARWLGGPLGRIKVGHVLIAYGQKPARRSH
jgi:ubiquinone/menaquinone biosynthesis C-methylase UbiE